MGVVEAHSEKGSVLDIVAGGDDGVFDRDSVETRAGGEYLCNFRFLCALNEGDIKDGGSELDVVENGCVGGVA